MSLGRLATRTLIGGLFIGHGTQKLFGWFGGHGLDGTAGFFESSLGLRPGKRHATLAGAGEAGTGVLLVTGALTPVAALAMTATMTTAIRKVHATNGPWAADSGWEYNAVLIAAAAALAETGPGSPSIDDHLFPRFRGPVVAALAVALGAAGSYIATEVLSDEAPADAGDVAAANSPSTTAVNGSGAGEPAGAHAAN